MQLGVGFFEHVKRSHQKRTRAASRVTHPDAGQLGLPGLPKAVLRHVAGLYRFGGMGAFVLVGFAPAAAHVKLILQCQKAINDDGVHRLLDDKAGDVVWRVDHAVAFALAVHAAFASCGGIGRSRGSGSRAQGELRHISGAGNALQVTDALLKNTAQHGHADFLGVVVTGQLGKTADQFVADHQRVECGVRRKQAAVVGRDFQVRIANVYRPKQRYKIDPARVGVVRVDVRGSGVDRALWQQATAFSKGDEQQPVNQLLGVRDQVSKSNAAVELVQAQDEFLPQGFVVVVERLGDFTLLLGVGFEQVLRGVAQQIARFEQAAKAGVTRRLQQLGGRP